MAWKTSNDGLNNPFLQHIFHCILRKLSETFVSPVEDSFECIFLDILEKFYLYSRFIAFKLSNFCLKELKEVENLTRLQQRSYFSFLLNLITSCLPYIDPRQKQVIREQCNSIAKSQLLSQDENFSSVKQSFISSLLDIQSKCFNQRQT
eukprot:snap_masked-scaffold_145-processed-gene-0.0-mRNA-1 protein AED:1.00 eAED:1.00 QI:0/-1/0/0/-1/1/1/0/148